MPFVDTGLYHPRHYQVGVFDAYERGIRRFMQVWHRRAGKDVTDFNFLVGAATERPATYYYMFPTLAQARRVMWDAIDPRSNVRMVDHIPEDQIIKKRENDMSIIIKALDNKGKLDAESFIQFLGADNFDANVGTPPYGTILF